MHAPDRWTNTATLLSSLVLAVYLANPSAFGQTDASSEPIDSQYPQRKSEVGLAESTFILKMTVREIVVGIVALDRHNRPINDLKESEFRVFEGGKGPRNTGQTILGFHVIDPARPKRHSDVAERGFLVSSGESCAIAKQSHYEIAFHPDPRGWTNGYHEILVRTSRPRVRLLYRRRYYVGETKTLSDAEPADNPKWNAELQMAACYHPLTPSSISLNAQMVPTTDGSLRFSLAVQADSLVFIALSNDARQVQLDYGVCTFDAEGLPLAYGHTPMKRVLTHLEYERAIARGFQKLIEVPRQGEPAVVRFAVRDRKTGNLGTLTAAVAHPVPDALLVSQREAKTKPSEIRAQADIARVGYLPALDGPIRSFGSIVPQFGAMCGDVYELPERIAKLPDFWSLNPIGSVFAYELDVPAQNIKNSSAIPGVTPKVDWFGIDYYGEFYIEAAGDYTFRLFSDDGAKLYIDDDLVISLDGLHDVLDKQGRLHLDIGRHTLHLPYLQGPGGVSLILLIKPPDGKYKVFDARDFAAPAEEPGASSN